jgi:hypothetical protein
MVRSPNHSQHFWANRVGRTEFLLRRFGPISSGLENGTSGGGRALFREVLTIGCDVDRTAQLIEMPGPHLVRGEAPPPVMETCLARAEPQVFHCILRRTPVSGSKGEHVTTREAGDPKAPRVNLFETNVL